MSEENKNDVTEVGLGEFGQEVFLQAKMPAEYRTALMLLGAPGSGKTAKIKSLSPNCFGDFVASVMDEEHPKGMFYRKEDGSGLAVGIHPDFEAYLSRAEAYGKPSILFIDEWADADKEVQKPLHRLVYDRIICGRKIPDNVVIVSASNSRKHGAGANALMSHTTSRFIMYYLRTKPVEWLEWGSEGDPKLTAILESKKLLPEGYADENGKAIKMVPRIHPFVLSQISSKPALLYSIDGIGSEDSIALMLREAKDGISYPCCRTWHRVSNILYFTGPNKKPSLATIQGCIGPALASSFFALLGIELPSNEDLINGVVEWPTELNESWASLVRAGQMLTPGNSKATLSTVTNLSPEMVEIFIRVAGPVCNQYLVSNGKKKCPDPKSALYFFPGARDAIFHEGSRYVRALEMSMPVVG